jgi:hypothetical protein
MALELRPRKPAPTTSKFGVRIDYGPRYVQSDYIFQKFYLQVNKGASNKTLKELADKDSHKIWSNAEVLIEAEESTQEEPVKAGSPKDTGKDPLVEKIGKLFDDLEDNITE